ncbi:MAG: hypothetical protein AABX69_04740 [Nanoarchaeota archaeon]
MASNASDSTSDSTSNVVGRDAYLEGREYLVKAIQLKREGAEPLQIAIYLSSARQKTEQALAGGYSPLEAIVQVVDVCCKQFAHFYSIEGVAPNGTDLYERITRHMELAVSTCKETTKSRSDIEKNSAGILYLLSLIPALISVNSHKRFPQPYSGRFADACEELGGVLAMAGIQDDERVAALLNVRP